ncbi:MAG: hypothetical protein OEY86_14795 [Nitrospira sp.]|nr:hypothetical protein [Nitrospira sp.]
MMNQMMEVKIIVGFDPEVGDFVTRTNVDWYGGSAAERLRCLGSVIGGAGDLLNDEVDRLEERLEFNEP